MGLGKRMKRVLVVVAGAVLLVVGVLLLVLGVFAMFYIRERRLWVWIRADAAGGAHAPQPP